MMFVEWVLKLALYGVLRFSGYEARLQAQIRRGLSLTRELPSKEAREFILTQAKSDEKDARWTEAGERVYTWLGGKS